MDNADVVYDGFSFADAGLILEDIDHMRLASRSNQIEPIANADGGVLVQSQLGTKPILIEGYYLGDSIEDAQDMYDTLARVLNRQERQLIVPHGSGTRSYTATPESVVMKEPDGLNKLTFSIEFVVPSGASTTEDEEELISETTITTATATIQTNVIGSKEARPVIDITVDAVTGGTGGSISIRNAADFIGLTIERDFVAGDEIRIDSNNFQIYINGVLTEPSGRLPKWQAGAGSLFYSDTFTTRTVTINGSYTPKYL